jgi:hypothetical protein
VFDIFFFFRVFTIHLSPFTLYLVLLSHGVFIHIQLHRVKVPRWLSRYCNSQQAEQSGKQITVAARFSVPVQTGPGAHPASYTMSTGSFPGVNGRGVALTTHPNLAPMSEKELSYTSITPLFLHGRL